MVHARATSWVGKQRAMEQAMESAYAKHPGNKKSIIVTSNSIINKTKQGPNQTKKGSRQTKQGPNQTNKCPSQTKKGPSQTKQGPVRLERAPGRPHRAPIRPNSGPVKPNNVPIRLRRAPIRPNRGPRHRQTSSSSSLSLWSEQEEHILSGRRISVAKLAIVHLTSLYAITRPLCCSENKIYLCATDSIYK